MKIKKLTRKEQAKQTQSNIYNAAIQLFEQNGFENVSIENITTAAGTARGTFYLYYASKQDLLRYAVIIYDEISEQAYEWAKKFETFEERLMEFCLFSYKEIEKHGKEILKALMSNNLFLDNKIFMTSQREIYNSLNKLISFGIETGKLDNKIDIDEYVNTLMLFVHGLDYYWCDSSDNFDLQKAVQTYLKYYINGILISDHPPIQ